jgi:2,3-bisphosphoglycerate-dependent phosphoglycerate mutase
MKLIFHLKNSIKRGGVLIDIVNLNIPTGIPLIYELDENLNPIKNYYLAESSKLEEEVSKVANQGK